MFFTLRWLWVCHIILTIRFSPLRVWRTATWDQVTSLPTGRAASRHWAYASDGEGASTDSRLSLSTVARFAAALPDSESTVNVEGVRLKAVLCCTAGRDCEPCLQVAITIQGEGLAQTPVCAKGICLPHSFLTTTHLCFIAASHSCILVVITVELVHQHSLLCAAGVDRSFISDRSLTGSVFSFRN